MILEIVIHCSATREGNRFTFEQCKDSHMNERGWSDIGYHYYIEIDGTIHEGRPIEKRGAHVKGHNSYTCGVCYEGGLDSNGKPKDTRTKKQKAAIYEVIKEIMEHPMTRIEAIKGHRDYPGVTKACPSFDAFEEYRWITA